jgi:signal transduction histidine kinase/CheY-like chemotaxis protein
MYERVSPDGAVASAVPTSTGTDLASSSPSSSSSDHVDEHHALIACLIFVVALLFNLNAAAWSVHANKTRLNLQVAFISAVAAWTHREMWLGRDWYVAYESASTSGAVGGNVSFSGLRQLEWVFTTPVLLLLVQNLHAYALHALPSETRERKSTYVPVNRTVLIVADIVMIVCGLVMPLTVRVERVAFLVLAVACFFFVIAHSLRALADVLRSADLGAAERGRVLIIAALKVVAWSGYPVIYFATEWGYLSCKEQHDLYLYNDVLTKFTYSLVISAGALRFIEVAEERRTAFAVHMTNLQRAFFFSITHELRTPLNSIIGFNTLAVESGELTEFTGSFIRASLTSAEALLGLINQILDFAKFEGAKDALAAGKDGEREQVELSSDAFTPRRLVEHLTDISQKASSRGVELVLSVHPPECFHRKFVGDFFRLRQCCVNLVDNAIKYSSDVEGRSSVVEFRLDIEDGAEAGTIDATFEVRDNGVGIPEEKRRSVFVPFCQPAEHKTAKTKGTGLGLVITKAIVECMGGKIDFESEPGAWTKFFFTVPLKKHVASRSAEQSDGGRDGSDDDDSVPFDFADDDPDDASAEDRFETIPPNARTLFHPDLNENAKRHLKGILRCFGGEPRKHFASVQSEEKLDEGVERARRLGAAVVLADVEATRRGDLLRRYAHRPVGLLIVGLPFQLIELHRDPLVNRGNVRTVLKPVKPSDLIKAMRDLVENLERWDDDAEKAELARRKSADSVDVDRRLETARHNEKMNRSNPGLAAVGVAEEGHEGRGHEGQGHEGHPTEAREGQQNASGQHASIGGASRAPLDRDAVALRGMRVLLVEDNVMNQQMATFSVAKCGAELTVANHGGEAVDAVAALFEAGEANFDCVLMDMMMPVMDGAKATRAIRAMERAGGREPHVIVGLSANTGPEYTAEVKAAGMNGSMSKPFYPATLRATLASVRQGTYKGF